jgi:uncharacterized protein YjbI with pentapeptide repeats
MVQKQKKLRNTIPQVLRLCVRAVRLLLLLVVIPPFWIFRWLVRTVAGCVKRYYLVLLGFATLPLLYFVLWVLPEWQILPLKLAHGISTIQIVEAETHARAVWAQITGGALLLVGLFFTYRRIEVAREGQITDRFIRAMELLGDEKEEIRLGAIYSLERIARDSAKDYWSVISILTAFVRAKRSHPNGLTGDVSTFARLPADVLAILGVLVRRPRGREGPEQRLNLSDTDLRGVAFKDAHFERAFFSDAMLDRAQFLTAKVPEMNAGFFKGTTDGDGRLLTLELDEERWRLYQQRRLGGCPLEGANLDRASLAGAFMPGIHLEKASLAFAKLNGSVLWDARLNGASLVSADLEGVLLDRADLRGCSLYKTSFKNAQLYGTNFEGTWFWETDLDGAKFAIGDDSKLRVNLKGANLKTAKNITAEQLRFAIVDEKTTLPDYLAHQGQSPAHNVPLAVPQAAQESGTGDQVVNRSAGLLEKEQEEKPDGNSTPSV